MTKILGTLMPSHPQVGAGFVYEASLEEAAAAELLRDKGWHLSAPSCPLCHGVGDVNRIWQTTGEGTNRDPISTTLTSDPCPNGCGTPAWIF